MRDFIKQIIDYLLDCIDYLIYYLRVRIVRTFLIWLGTHLVDIIIKFQEKHFQFFQDLYASEIFRNHFNITINFIRFPFLLWEIYRILFLLFFGIIILFIYYLLFKMMIFCLKQAIKHMKLSFFYFNIFIKNLYKKIYNIIKNFFF